MKKITCVFILFCLVIINTQLVQSQTGTAFDDFIVFEHDEIQVVGNRTVTISIWRDKSSCAKSIPADAYGKVSYQRGIFQSVAKGSYLQIDLNPIPFNNTDFEFLVMSMELTGIPNKEDRPHFFLTKKMAEYFELDPTMPVTQEDLEMIDCKLSNLQDNSIKKILKQSSMFVLDLSIMPYNYNSLILDFAVLKDINMKTVSFSFLSWKSKSEDSGESFFEIFTHIIDQVNGYAIGFTDPYGAVNKDPSDAQFNQSYQEDRRIKEAVKRIKIGDINNDGIPDLVQDYAGIIVVSLTANQSFDMTVKDFRVAGVCNIQAGDYWLAFFKSEGIKPCEIVVLH